MGVTDTAYEPTVWATGDVVTADKLNKLEEGVANASGGGLIVHSVYDETTEKHILDKTWTEIYNAFIAGNNVCIIEDNREFPDGGLNIWADLIVSDDGLSNYSVACNFGATGYNCDNSNDYPSMNG